MCLPVALPGHSELAFDFLAAVSHRTGESNKGGLLLYLFIYFFEKVFLYSPVWHGITM